MTQLMQTLVAQIGARRHYAVPAALHAAGLLSGFYTDICMATPWLRCLGRVMPRSAPLPGWRSLIGREPVGVPDRLISSLWSSPWTGYQLKKLTRCLGQYSRWQVQNEKFGRDVVRRGFGSAESVYAFNGAAVEIFEAAKQRGLKCVLDMTIAPLETIEGLLQEERGRFPRLEPDSTVSDPPHGMIARERREWELADLILCGSEYVSNSLRDVGIDPRKLRVVRWGYSGPSVVVDREQRTAPLRVLIAGTVELRKGVPYVLDAARRLSSDQFQFRFVGPIRLDRKELEAWQRQGASASDCHCDFIGAVPRTAMTLEYQAADVLLHPSLAEGSANVCYEAMAHGLPVIATPNAGAAITDGVDGLIIPIRDPQAIADALQRLAIDATTRRAMGQAARQTASRHTLAQYQLNLADAIRSLTSNHFESAAKNSPPVKV